jgi:hypothetical protein
MLLGFYYYYYYYYYYYCKMENEIIYLLIFMFFFLVRHVNTDIHQYGSEGIPGLRQANVGGSGASLSAASPARSQSVPATTSRVHRISIAHDGRPVVQVRLGVLFSCLCFL